MMRRYLFPQMGLRAWVFGLCILGLWLIGDSRHNQSFSNSELRAPQTCLLPARLKRG